MKIELRWLTGEILDGGRSLKVEARIANTSMARTATTADRAIGLLVSDHGKEIGIEIVHVPTPETETRPLRGA